MTSNNNVLYTARTHSTGGRDGASRTDDGRLDIQLSSPDSAGKGTNPEQLFAAGWSACFLSALKVAAQNKATTLPPDIAIDAEVDLVKSSDGFHLQARLNVELPGVPRDLAQAMVDDANAICPYSKATRGNIDAAIRLV